MIGDELLNFSRQLRQVALDPRALLGAEPVKRFGHKIVANAYASQGALDSLDDSRRMASDLIKRIADVHDLGVKLPGTVNIPGTGCFIKLHIEPGEKVGSPRDTPVTAGEDRIR